jgi:hypothetical protein
VGKKQNTGLLDVQEIAKAAAIEALKLQKTEERQRIRKNRFHNTELLLNNYLSLVESYENAVDKASEIEEITETYNFKDIDLDDIIIQSIRRSKIRTKVMINQIDTCLERLRIKMIAKGQPEKVEVIEKLYLDSKKITVQWSDRITMVAAEIPCGESSVRRWRNEMIDELSILLFGVDGLRLEV